MKKYITIAMVLVLGSTSIFAAERTITKSLKPSRIVVAKAGFGLASFPVLSSHFLPNTQLFLAPKKLEGISWRTTHYPDNLFETVKLCYYQPLANEPTDCENIEPNSSGITHKFDSYTFDKHARVTIMHRVTGGKNHGAAAGVDTVTIHYSY